MRLYEITYSGRKWETTNPKDALGFGEFSTNMGFVVTLRVTFYEGDEMPNIQVA